MTVLACLSLDQPYATAVVTGRKRNETRPRPLAGPMRPDGVRPLPGRRVERGERIAIAATGRAPVPGPVGIVGPDDDDLDPAGEVGRWSAGGWWWEPKPRAGYRLDLPLGPGLILGTVAVVDVRRFEDLDYAGVVLTQTERALGWYAAGRWVYRLADPDELAEPVHCPGCLVGRPGHMHQGVWSLPAGLDLDPAPRRPQGSFR